MNKDSSILIVGHNDVIDRSLYDYFKKNNHTRVFWSYEIGLDTTIQPSVYSFFIKHKPEYIYLTSVKSGGIEANQKFPADFIYSNLESQNNIFYSANKFKAKKVVFIASSCVYPKTCSQPMKEEYLFSDKMEQTSLAYSTAKLAGIVTAHAFKKQYGLNAISVIPATIYGPGSDIDLEKAHVLGALLNKIHVAEKEEKASIDLWGSGNPKREFLYCDDFVEGIIFLTKKYDGDEAINLGYGQDISIRNLAEMISEIVDFKGLINFDPTKPDGAMQKLLDSVRIKELGWMPKMNLKDGIKETYDWFKQLNK